MKHGEVKRGDPESKSRSESRLHDELKRRYAETLGGRTEQTVEGFQVDVLKEKAVVEVQVEKLAALRDKLRTLSSRGYTVQVVFPIQGVLTSPVRRRASGRSYLRTVRRKASLLDVFRELVHFPELLSIPGVRLELLLLHEQRLFHGVRRTVWRGGRPRSRLLNAFNRDTAVVEMLDLRLIESKMDLLRLLPPGLPRFFTNHDLAKAAGISYPLSSRTTYALTRMGVLRKAGKHERRDVYAVQPF